MKCAGELVAISLKVEEQRRLEQERIIAEKLRALKGKTINWCEEIGKILEEKAMDAQPLEYNISLMIGADGETYYPIEEVSSRYRDGRKDYNIYWSYDIHLPTIIEFFEKYCFEATLKKFKYAVYSRGFGIFSAYTLTIKPAPQCFYKKNN